MSNFTDKKALINNLIKKITTNQALLKSKLITLF